MDTLKTNLPKLCRHDNFALVLGRLARDLEFVFGEIDRLKAETVVNNNEKEPPQCPSSQSCD